MIYYIFIRYKTYFSKRMVIQIGKYLLHANKILPGYALAKDFPELDNCLLVCATETKTEYDLESYIAHVAAALEEK